MSHYENLSTPPQDAIKPIGFGNLKGKSDINPQWRYEALTKEYGDCGIGWKFEIVNTIIQPVPETKELMVFVQVNFYTKNGEDWSAPVPGFGGDFLIKKDKNGLHGNDEAYKMATTDALGTAAKMVGVAADIYRGKLNDGRCDTKYNRRENEQERQSVDIKIGACVKKLQDKATQLGICDKVNAIAHFKYNVAHVMKLDEKKIVELTEHLKEFYEEMESAA